MSMPSIHRPHRHEPLFDTHPVTGASIEVFYADRALETFGRCGAGWFWGAASTRLFAGWLACWSVRYELRSVSARNEREGDQAPMMHERLAKKPRVPCAKRGHGTSGHARLGACPGNVGIEFAPLHDAEACERAG
jgi:hypothetical protein